MIYFLKYFLVLSIISLSILDCSKDNNELEFDGKIVNNYLSSIYLDIRNGYNNNSADLFYVLQRRDQSLTLPQKILSRSTDDNAITSGSIYRSCLLYINNKYYIYYSCISKQWKRGIALISGEYILNLQQDLHR